MNWDAATKQRLAREWETRPDEEDARAFDDRLAQALGCSPRAVQTQRSRIGLVAQTNATSATTTATLPDEAPEAPEKEAEIDEALDREVEELLSRERNRLAASAHQREIKRTVRSVAKREDLLRLFLESARRLPVPRRSDRPKCGTGRPEEEVVVVISDCQIGAKTHRDYVQGVSRYSVEVFKERAERHLKAVMKILEDRSWSAPIPRLRVFLLGDIIDGQGIYGPQAYETEIGLTDQLLEGVQTLSRSISAWSSIAPEVSVHCVPGNHGRISKEAAAWDNHEVTLYQFMAAQLKDHRNVTFDIQRSPFHLVEIMGWRFLLTHGDEVSGGSMSRSAQMIEGRFRGLLHAARLPQPDYYVFGDHHQQMTIESNGGEILANGCWPGGSTYSIGKFVLSSRPSQLVLGVSKEEGISWRYKIDLDRFPV